MMLGERRTIIEKDTSYRTMMCCQKKGKLNAATSRGQIDSRRRRRPKIMMMYAYGLLLLVVDLSLFITSTESFILQNRQVSTTFIVSRSKIKKDYGLGTSTIRTSTAKFSSSLRASDDNDDTTTTTTTTTTVHQEILQQDSQWYQEYVLNILGEDFCSEKFLSGEDISLLQSSSISSKPTTTSATTTKTSNSSSSKIPNTVEWRMAKDDKQKLNQEEEISIESSKQQVNETTTTNFSTQVVKEQEEKQTSPSEITSSVSASENKTITNGVADTDRTMTEEKNDTIKSDTTTKTKEIPTTPLIMESPKKVQQKMPISSVDEDDCYLMLRRYKFLRKKKKKRVYCL